MPMLHQAQVDRMLCDAQKDVGLLSAHIETLVSDRRWLVDRLRCLLEMLKREPTYPEEQDPNWPEMPLISGPLWHKVACVTGLGSSSAVWLCIELGQDPDHEKPRPEPEDEDDESNSDL